MNKISTVLNVVLLIAVSFLFYKLYAGPTQGKPTSESEVAGNFQSQSFNGAKVAYINTDSLVEKYDYHKELRSKLEVKAKALEADIADKARVFEENLAIMQQQAEKLSPQQLQAAQAELGQKQQELYAYRDQKAGQLAQEEQELTALIKEDMQSVMDDVKGEYELDYILSFDPNSILLSANEQYNITDIVVSRLNEKYTQEKNSETAEK